MQIFWGNQLFFLLPFLTGDATTFQISITGDDALGNTSEVDEASAAYNKGLMSKLLDQVVAQTKGYTVERLEKLYSILSQCIYHHRLDLDKSELCLVSNFSYVHISVL